jgi:hypothetical protein
MICANCGREIPEINQGQFCLFCGAALAQPANTGQLSAPSDSPAGGGQRFYCPWENREALGFVAALSQTWTESVLRPTAFFQQMPRTGGIGAAMLYAILVGSIGALFSLFWEYQLFDKLGTWQDWPADVPFPMNRGLLLFVVPVIPLALIISLLLMSLIYHVCLLITGSAKNGWEVTFRVIAYASGPSVFLFLPVCGGIVAAGWCWILQIIGWTQAHESTTARVVVAALLPLLLCCGVIFWAIAMFASLFRDLPIPQVLAGQILRAFW